MRITSKVIAPVITILTWPDLSGMDEGPQPRHHKGILITRIATVTQGKCKDVPERICCTRLAAAECFSDSGRSRAPIRNHSAELLRLCRASCTRRGVGPCRLISRRNSMMSPFYRLQGDELSGNAIWEQALSRITPPVP